MAMAVGAGVIFVGGMLGGKYMLGKINDVQEEEADGEQTWLRQKTLTSAGKMDRKPWPASLARARALRSHTLCNPHRCGVGDNEG